MGIEFVDFITYRNLILLKIVPSFDKQKNKYHLHKTHKRILRRRKFVFFFKKENKKEHDI